LALFDDERQVSRAIGHVLAHGIVPRCAELLDASALAAMRLYGALPIPESARALLIIELDGEDRAIEHATERCGALLQEHGARDVLVAREGRERDTLWAARRQMSYAMRKLAKHKLAEDVVVPRSRMASLLELTRQLSECYAIQIATYGHAGDGNLHVNFLWNDDSERARVDKAIVDLFTAVIQMGGTLSGEHGIGLLKAPYLPLEQSAQLIDLQSRIKQLFDPKGILNPGKIFPAQLAVVSHRAC
jgi:glycolate oxidase